MTFNIHTVDSAPAGSKATLQKIQDTYGFIPNLAGVLAESTGTLNYLGGAMAAMDASEITLSEIEKQVVFLTTSVTNRCEYCTAAHSMLASMNGLSQEDIESLQDGGQLSDPKLENLRKFVEHVVEARGFAEDKAIAQFIDAGYAQAQILEVVAGVSLKTLTNYANHIAEPKVNEQFAQFLPKWNVAA